MLTLAFRQFFDAWYARSRLLMLGGSSSTLLQRQTARSLCGLHHVAPQGGPSSTLAERRIFSNEVGHLRLRMSEAS